MKEDDMEWFDVRSKSADAQARKAACQGEKVQTIEGLRRCNATDMVVKLSDGSLKVLTEAQFSEQYDKAPASKASPVAHAAVNKPTL